MEPNYRLDTSDADFVDIIHTCGGIYGYKNSHGHADFYPNSGKPAQPGCEGVQQKLGKKNKIIVFIFVFTYLSMTLGVLLHSNSAVLYLKGAVNIISTFKTIKLF